MFACCDSQTSTAWVEILAGVYPLLRHAITAPRSSCPIQKTELSTRLTENVAAHPSSIKAPETGSKTSALPVSSKGWERLLPNPQSSRWLTMIEVMLSGNTETSFTSCPGQFVPSSNCDIWYLLLFWKETMK